jgi:preprotein translocase subunit YajC
LHSNLIEQQQRKQMAQIREHLAALEEGTEPNVIDV